MDDSQRGTELAQGLFRSTLCGPAYFLHLVPDVQLRCLGLHYYFTTKGVLY